VYGYDVETFDSLHYDVAELNPNMPAPTVRWGDGDGTVRSLCCSSSRALVLFAIVPQVNRISLDVCSQQPGALTTTIKGAGHQGILFNKDGIQAVVDAVLAAKK